MRNLLFLFFLISCASLASAQQKEIIYIEFKGSDEEVCIIPNSDEERYHGVTQMKKFDKIKQANGDIEFYICGELFIFKNDSKTEKYSITDTPPFKYSDILELKKIINTENILYPEKVFKKVYLVEKMNDSSVHKYDVTWQYYIQ